MPATKFLKLFRLNPSTSQVSSTKSAVESPEKLQLFDLDEYSLLKILDFLEFDDLLTISSIKPELIPFITKHYMIPKYRIHERDIYLHLMTESNDILGPQISIGKSKAAKEFIKNFGHLFTSLAINAHSERNEVIRQSIEQYCSQTLIKFGLSGTMRYFLSESNASFPKLTKMNIAFPRYQGTYEISRIYPALKELSVDLTVGVDADLRDMISSAPSLRAFSTSFVLNSDILPFINRNHPNLESLGITYNTHIFQRDQQMIHFNKVKSLAIDITNNIESRDNSLPLSFSQLERLEIHLKHFANVPIDLIKRCVSLKSLFFQEWNEIIDVVNVLNRVNKTHSIEELSLMWSSRDGNEAEYTVRLLHDYPTLKKITFIVLDNSGPMIQRDRLLGTITSEWNAVVGRTRHLHSGSQQPYVTVTRRNMQKDPMFDD